MILLPRPRSSLLLPALLLMGSVALTAQETGRTTLGTGAIRAAGSGVMLAGTFGQPIIGSTTASIQRSWQGFWFPAETTVLSSVEPVAGEAPAPISSLRCLPNPFSESATVHAAVPHADHVTITLHDLHGREVMSLTDARNEQENLTVEFDAGSLECGWYTLVLDAGDAAPLTLPVHIIR